MDESKAKQGIAVIQKLFGHYAGWPVAVTAFRVLEEVWNAMDAETGGGE